MYIIEKNKKGGKFGRNMKRIHNNVCLMSEMRKDEVFYGIKCEKCGQKFWK